MITTAVPGARFSIFSLFQPMKRISILDAPVEYCTPSSTDAAQPMNQLRNNLSHYLKRFASPGFIPDRLAISISFFAILVIFPLDILTGSEVSLQVIYIFPLILIALHCSSAHVVAGILTLSILAQLIALITFTTESVLIKVFLFCMVFLSDLALVLISRYARFNILEAERLSTTDPLTQLSNRRALEMAIKTESTRQGRYGGVFSLVLIDLDGFKAVNDTLGHICGDQALVLMANILRYNTRTSDMVFRIGGDEFVVLMPNTEGADCKNLCDGFCQTIAEDMAKAGFNITASIGYTTVERPLQVILDILTIADKAMYEAKSGGKCRVVKG